MSPDEPAGKGKVSEEWVGERPVFGFGICSGRWKGKLSEADQQIQSEKTRIGAAGRVWI